MNALIPVKLVESCNVVPARSAWLQRLPSLIASLAEEWSLTLSEPIESSNAWVAPVTRSDGSVAVLKVSLPHWEGYDEIAGLRFWAGNPTVRLLESDSLEGAMLLERCCPGTALSTLPQPDQDHVIAALIRRLWRLPPSTSEFRPLSAMIARWSAETRTQSGQWLDSALVEQGLAVFEHMDATAAESVVIGTDIHAGNVLMAEREPWLVIDPKPFIGDPAYDATQHLLNCRSRLRTDPFRLVRGFARLLDIDAERVGNWLFARLAAEPRDVWDTEALELAQHLRSQLGIQA